MNRPESLTHLFLAFSRLALQGFGGVLAVAQRELVERLGWMSKEEFVETLAIAQVLPGPNIVNLSMMIGDRFFGLRGAFVALAGMRNNATALSFCHIRSHRSYGRREWHAVSAGCLGHTGARKPE